MIKKSITYTDFDGVERTDEAYFNLSKAELMEMAAEENGHYDTFLDRLIKEQKVTEIYRIFKALVEQAYGEKSPDGRRFIKSKELTDSFTQTAAYDELLLELVSDADAAAEFVNGIMPADLEQKLAKLQKDRNLQA